MESNYRNVVLERSSDFAANVIEYCELLDRSGKYAISNQLIRSATSIGANIHEAQNAESRQDFIHKVKVAAKEAHESEYWLVLCNKVKSYPPAPGLLEDSREMLRILSKILQTAILNSRKKS